MTEREPDTLDGKALEVSRRSPGTAGSVLVQAGLHRARAEKIIASGLTGADAQDALLEVLATDRGAGGYGPKAVAVALLLQALEQDGGSAEAVRRWVAASTAWALVRPDGVLVAAHSGLKLTRLPPPDLDGAALTTGLETGRVYSLEGGVIRGLGPDRRASGPPLLSIDPSAGPAPNRPRLLSRDIPTLAESEPWRVEAIPIGVLVGGLDEPEVLDRLLLIPEAAMPEEAAKLLGTAFAVLAGIRLARSRVELPLAKILLSVARARAVYDDRWASPIEQLLALPKRQRAVLAPEDPISATLAAGRTRQTLVRARSLAARRGALCALLERLSEDPEHHPRSIDAWVARVRTASVVLRDHLEVASLLRPGRRLTVLVGAVRRLEETLEREIVRRSASGLPMLLWRALEEFRALRRQLEAVGRRAS